MLCHKIVLITGASSGIGAACARQFAAKGARVLLCGRRTDRLSQLAVELNQKYAVPAHFFTLDVRHADEVNQALAALPVEWQQIDVLINNAGLAVGFASLQEGILADWETMLDTNVKGLLYMTRAILPRMLARNSGHIINIGSVAGHGVYPNGAVYCATKHAVKALTQGLRMDLFGKKIRVTSIDPGAVATEFSEVRFKGDTARAAAVYADMHPLSADDIADAILYCVQCPPHVNVSEMIIMPTAQAGLGMMAREK